MKMKRKPKLEDYMTLSMFSNVWGQFRKINHMVKNLAIVGLAALFFKVQYKEEAKLNYRIIVLNQIKKLNFL